MLKLFLQIPPLWHMVSKLSKSNQIKLNLLSKISSIFLIFFMSSFVSPCFSCHTLALFLCSSPSHLRSSSLSILVFSLSIRYLRFLSVSASLSFLFFSLSTTLLFSPSCFSFVALSSQILSSVDQKDGGASERRRRWQKTLTPFDFVSMQIYNLTEEAAENPNSIWFCFGEVL